MDNNLIVLIDGPRGSGKSTIAKGVVEVLNNNGTSATYFKKGARSPGWEDQNMLQHLEVFSKVNGVVVVDRFLLTEWVMSVWNERVDTAELFYSCDVVNKHIMELCALHYCITAPVNMLHKRIAERKTRGWDIDPAEVTGIWERACGIFHNVALMPNVLDDNGAIVIESIVKEVNYQIGETV